MQEEVEDSADLNPREGDCQSVFRRSKSKWKHQGRMCKIQISQREINVAHLEVFDVQNSLASVL